MRRFLILLAVLWVLCPVSWAQTVRQPMTDCPDPTSWVCQMWPHVCEVCEPVPTALRRVTPRGPPEDPNVESYRLQRSIGVVQIAHELYPVGKEITELMTNYDLAWEVRTHGFRTLKIWMKTSPFEGMGDWCWNTYYGTELCTDGDDSGTENMYYFWANTPIDTYIIRPTNISWTHEWLNSCTGMNTPQMAVMDYYSFAMKMFREIGWRDVTIILTDWEQDWIICDDYEWFLLQRIEQRQSDLERARRDIVAELGYIPALRIFHAVIVNRFPANSADYEPNLLAELISDLEYRPDFIGASIYVKGHDPIECLEWLSEVTGYPPSRIYVDEMGTAEHNQVELYGEYIPAIFDWGAPIINIWMWKQTWCDPKRNFGLWKQTLPCLGKVLFGEPTDGYYSLQKLMERYDGY